MSGSVLDTRDPKMDQTSPCLQSGHRLVGGYTGKDVFTSTIRAAAVFQVFRLHAFYT